jgi:hypothetical protein
VESSLKRSYKPAGSTKFQENLECLRNHVELEDRCGVGSLAKMIKTVASSCVSCDGNNTPKIFQQELIMTTYSSRPGYRVAEDSNEETLNTA